MTASKAVRFRTQSDCEVILPLYLEQGTDFLEELSGMYAFCLYDEDKDFWMMARDPIGIIPLYYGHDAHGQLFVASEMKALMDVCNQVHEFPPGHYWCRGQEEPQKWYQRDWDDFEAVEDAVTDRAALREALEDAVVSHLMTDVPYGVLLSGGLDSSITAALAAKHAAMRVEDHEESRPGGRACTPLPSAWKVRRTWWRRRKRPTTSARCTMASLSPSRKGWMRWKK